MEAPQTPQVRIAKVDGSNIVATVAADRLQLWLWGRSGGGFAQFLQPWADYPARYRRYIWRTRARVRALPQNDSRRRRHPARHLRLMAMLSTGSLSFLAIIGFVALIGIEIKNSILLVNFSTQPRARGLPLRDAIEQAGDSLPAGAVNVRHCDCPHRVDHGDCYWIMLAAATSGRRWSEAEPEAGCGGEAISGAGGR